MPPKLIGSPHRCPTEFADAQVLLLGLSDGIMHHATLLNFSHALKYERPHASATTRTAQNRLLRSTRDTGSLGCSRCAEHYRCLIHGGKAGQGVDHALSCYLVCLAAVQLPAVLGSILLAGLGHQRGSEMCKLMQVRV